MNVQINQLVRSLLQKDDIGQCSLQELQQFAEKNPYFGAAQLLLTKKMQTDAPAQYDEQLQKTFLFFNNPLWVEQVLNGTGKARITPAEKKEEVPAPVPVEKVLVKEEIPIELAVVEPIIEAEPEPVIEPVEEKQPEPITEPVAVVSEPVTEIHTEPIIEPASSTVEPVVVSPEEPKMDNPALAGESFKDELIFEPYHTVDYFASQGIKIKEEDKPTDKFGKQLKSFTDWLKSMKKLPVTEIAKAVETNSPAQAEKKVEQLAEHSLAEREVVTEAMAEVWEKQGNKAKAIEIYQKLSLLDPSKSPYFAAKIEVLNKET
jgi:hypothetical protein